MIHTWIKFDNISGNDPCLKQKRIKSLRIKLASILFFFVSFQTIRLVHLRFPSVTKDRSNLPSKLYFVIMKKGSIEFDQERIQRFRHESETTEA